MESSRIGLGTGRFASFGEGMTVARARELLRACAECGVELLDTADSYASGRAERLLGTALRAATGPRPPFRLVTKSGYRFGNLPFPLHPLNPFLKKFLQRTGPTQDFSPGRIERSILGSLGRLKVERLDGFLLHDPPLDAVQNPALIEVLVRAVSEGRMRAFGVSSDRPEVLAAAHSAGALFLEAPVHPRMEPALAESLTQLAGRGCHVIANHVLSVLPMLPPASAERVRALGTRFNLPERGILLQFALSRPWGGTVLVGTKNPAHLREARDWETRTVPVAALDGLMVD